ncbi:MAG: RNA-guided pseudouridylation complex pseudouridine synthase subunit Cbf5 [Thermoplasmatota archaeon]
MDALFEGEHVEILDSTDTDHRYGHYPSKRPLELLMNQGLIVLDKPRGPTSHQVVSWVKGILGIERAGHHGTLDPNTTGVLPIALGGAVRMLDLTLEEGKEYIALMHLHREVNGDHLRTILGEFTGRIYQMVPVRSAVKRGLRERSIEQMKVLDNREGEVLLRISCESGTYIRTLIHDMGEVLGVGANMVELRRSRSGRLREDSSVTLQGLRDAWELFKDSGSEEELRRVIHPSELLVDHLPKAYLKDSAVDAVCHGAPVGRPGLGAMDTRIRKGSHTAVMTLKGEIVALGTSLMDYGEAAGRSKGMCIKVDRVIMDPGTYPRAWKTRSGKG